MMWKLRRKPKANLHRNQLQPPPRLPYQMYDFPQMTSPPPKKVIESLIFFRLQIKIKGISSGETTRSRNSASCSIERTISEKEKDKNPGQGQTTATKVTYVNERRPRPQAHGGSGGGGGGDERFEFKTRPRKLLKGGSNCETD